MRCAAPFLALLLAATTARAQDRTLRVVHTGGDGTARPSGRIAISFDRPVAGRLDATIDPSRIVRVEPAGLGRVEWRDPATIRFVATAPIAPGTTLRFTVDTTFHAIDGSRLEAPYTFSVRVSGAVMLAASFLESSELPIDGRVQVVYSASVDAERLARRARIVIDRCGLSPAPMVPLLVVRQRLVAQGDPWSFREAGGRDRDTVGDRFRRVIELEPRAPLPPECAGTLILPTTPDDSANGAEERFTVSTANRFRLARAECESSDYRCAMTRLDVAFTADVRRADVERYVHIEPALRIADGRGRDWTFEGVRPHTTYTIALDSALRDVHGRAITGVIRRLVATGDYAPSLQFPRGVLTTPRSGAHTIPIRSVNVGSVRVIHAVVPPTTWPGLAERGSRLVEHDLLSVNVRPETTVVSLHARFNTPISSELPIPGSSPDTSRFVVLRVEPATALDGPSASHAVPPTRPDKAWRPFWAYTPDYAFVQITDLALHARAGAREVMVVVTGLADGRPRAGVPVTQRALDGRVVARAVTDSVGVARWVVSRDSAAAASYVEAELGEDHVFAMLGYRGLGMLDASPLEPSRLGARTGGEPAAAAALIAERGIYRPGEMLYLEGVVRHGALGSLQPAAAGERVRLTLRYSPYEWGSDDPPMYDTVLTTSARGSVVDSLRLPSGARLGPYLAELHVAAPEARDEWEAVARAPIKIAEYRAPEFLVETRADSAPHYGDDTLAVAADARFLFGAPMGHGSFQWSATARELSPWEIRIPGAEGWTVGVWEWQRPDAGVRPPATLAGADSLGSDGRTTFRVPLAGLRFSRPGRVEVSIAVTDLNRQVVTSSVSVPVHPARLCILVRSTERSWLWPLGRPAHLELRTVHPDGTSADGTSVIVTVSRYGWMEGANGEPGRWDEAVVRTDTVRAGGAATPYAFVPTEAGTYILRFAAGDGHGAVARTSFYRYASSGGGGWWARSPYALPLVAESLGVAVGGEAHLAFDSPWDEADGWLSVEREGIIEQRHIAVHRGTNTVSLRVAGSYVPNVFVSLLLTRRGTSAAQRPDSAAQRLRVGYVELHVSTDTRRLAVAVRPSAREYGPGDTARFRVQVSDASGRGARSGVTLWAVDEGVLALTGYATPDVLSRIYDPRPLAIRLWSTGVGLLTTSPGLVVDPVRGQTLMLESLVVTGIEAGYAKEPTPASPSMPRSIFRPTAFYVADVPTDGDGVAEVSARLPDNVTTFRVFAIAVGSDDRFGSGDTSIVATRALVARPSLPRFVRPADTLRAGAVVNVRDGRARGADVVAESNGIALQGEPRTHVELAEGRGAEARFAFTVPPRDRAPDSVSVRLRASDGAAEDAVAVRLPVRPDYAPRTHTVIGAARGSDDVVVPLPADVDPARSTLTIRFGSSPLPAILEANGWLRRYPYECTEQLASAGRAELAIWRATRPTDPRAPDDAQRRRVQTFADHIARRQRQDGAFRYWDDYDWSSPWLTAWAGEFLIEARAQGIVVDSTVLRRAALYLDHIVDAPIDTSAPNRFERAERRIALGGRVAAVDFLRRVGDPDVEAEDALLAVSRSMTWEDRLRLATVLAGRADRIADARSLLDAAWRATTVAGHAVDIPDSAHGPRTFRSHLVPATRLLQATLAIEPDHALLGALVETLLSTGRAGQRSWWWSTQDYAEAVISLVPLAAAPKDARIVRVTAGGRTLLEREAADSSASAAIPLTGLLRPGAHGTPELRLRLGVARADRPIYYAVSVTEVPSKPPITPDATGIVVERWYERFDDGRPVTSVREGELVRVRMRVTVPADREFVAVEDPLPAGLEIVDLSLNTSSTLQPFVTDVSRAAEMEGDVDRDGPRWQSWLYGRWDNGWWSPWEHVSRYDDRVVYFARMLWAGSYTASYVVRATTSGTFTRPPAHAEEMYDPAVQGRSDGGRFGVEEKR